MNESDVLIHLVADHTSQMTVSISPVPHTLLTMGPQHSLNLSTVVITAEVTLCDIY